LARNVARTVSFYFALRQPFIAISCKRWKMQQNNWTHKHGIGGAPTIIGGGCGPIIKSRRRRRTNWRRRRGRRRAL